MEEVLTGFETWEFKDGVEVVVQAAVSAADTASLSPSLVLMSYPRVREVRYQRDTELYVLYDNAARVVAVYDRNTVTGLQAMAALGQEE